MKRQAVDYSNRRQAERRETCLKARITYGARDSVTLDCTIRNLSSGGAMLDLPEGALLPPTFRLLNTGDGFAYDAQIVWRRGRELGVAFSRIEDLRPASLPVARGLRAVLKTLKRS